MKKIAIAFTALLAVSQLNAGTINQSIESTIVAAINNEVVNSGTVTEVTENGVKLMENETGIVREFYHPGATVDFQVGDKVMYIIISGVPMPATSSRMKNGVVKFYN